MISFYIGSNFPESYDPLDYDSIAHHVVFRSVFATLVNQYKRGSFSGQLAKSWSVSSDKLIWTFDLHDNLTFSDGKPITPEVVESSLLRLGFMKHKKNSKSDFFDSLIGYDQLKEKITKIPGIETKSHQIIFRLKSPYSKLLEELSFGNFSVTDPNDWDRVTGEWKDKKQMNTPGAYQVEQWDSTSISLKKRSHLPVGSVHPLAAEKINIFWGETKQPADILIGSSTSPLEGYTFHGPAPANMSFVHVYAWKDKNSLLSNLDNRRFLRESFYTELEKLGFDITRSFFPLTIPHIKELESLPINNFSISGKNSQITIRKSAFPERFVQEGPEILKKVFKAAGVSAEIKFFSFTQLKEKGIYNPNNPTFETQLGISSSGLLLEDPYGDVRFMFLSKEGICLPDSSGDILKEIKRTEKFNLQYVNEKLWEQAIIWPLTHYSLGVYVNKKIDMSEYNSILPPIDFTWIGLKK